jgi:MoaA/NifB/PqqE/SkfB family radical SAM enzyme
VLDDARILGCKTVQFIGGEPTLNRQLISFARQARELGYEFIEVYTNLTILTDEMLRSFLTLNIHVATSFYSADKGIHESIINVKGSFERTVSAITSLVENGVPLRVGLIKMEQNQDCIDNAIAFLRVLGVKSDMINVDEVRSMGRGSKIKPFRSLEDTLCLNRWKGKLAVLWDDSVFPCVFSRSVVIGNVLESSLASILNSDMLENFRSWAKGRQDAKSKTQEPHSLHRCGPDYCNPDNACSPAHPRNPVCNPHVKTLKCGPHSCSPNGCIPDSPCVP